MTPALVVKCDRHGECEKRLAEACERLECPFRNTHPALESRLDGLERRAERQEDDVKDLAKAINSLKGWIVGACAAASAIGALAGIVARGAGK